MPEAEIFPHTMERLPIVLWSKHNFHSGLEKINESIGKATFTQFSASWLAWLPQVWSLV
jgi:hypothetical protein